MAVSSSSVPAAPWPGLYCHLPGLAMGQSQAPAFARDSTSILIVVLVVTGRPSTCRWGLTTKTSRHHRPTDSPVFPASCPSHSRQIRHHGCDKRVAIDVGPLLH